MLIGLTETFPNGVHYGQQAFGGTSLASPLLAGIIALADQAAGGDIPGFLNPTLYTADASGSATGFYDVVPQGDLAVFLVSYANGLNKADGYVKGAITLGYQGPETHCSSPGTCQTQNVTIYTAPGYDR